LCDFRGRSILVGLKKKKSRPTDPNFEDHAIGYFVSSNKTDCHDIIEILLKMALSQKPYTILLT
jgi:hypothetical protein